MSYPSAISQGQQVGIESTYAVDVDADKKLQSLSFVMTPDLAFERYRAAGNKFTSAASITQIQSAANIPVAALNYTEINYPFSSIFGEAVITTPGGGTLSRQWEYEVAADAATPPQSLTVQSGDGTTFTRANGVVVNKLDIKLEEGAGATISGDGFGGRLAFDSGAMDALAGTQPSLLVANWTQASVYIDPIPGTSTEAAYNAALGTTKQTAIFQANPSFGDRYTLVRVLDAALAGSPAAIAEVPVSFQVDFMMAADAFGRGLMDAAEDQTPKLIRVELVGPIIEGAIPYKITFDMYGVIADGGDEGERNGAQSISWTFDMAFSSVWTRAMRVRVVNVQTAL